MPSWLRRLFSRDYRNAIAAEAAGDYILAAEQFALAGMPLKVAEMHLIRAKRVDAAARADVLDDALRWIRRVEDPESIPEDLRKELSQALLVESKALSMGDPRRLSLATQAAELNEELGNLREAGEAYELVGEKDEAVRCYEAAGHIEGMERLLEEETRSRASTRAVDDAFEEYESALRIGDRAGARAALRRCCSDAPGQGYERMLNELEKKFPEPGQVVLRLDGLRFVVIGASPAFLGRGDAHLRLRHAGISRRHAAIDQSVDGFALRDAGSRNGTLIGGLPLAGSVPLDGSGIIGLGDQCTLQFSASSESVELEVLDGPDRGLKAIVVKSTWTSPNHVFDVAFRDGLATVFARDGGTLSINGSPTKGPITLLYGDTIEASGGGRLEVLS